MVLTSLVSHVLPGTAPSSMLGARPLAPVVPAELDPSDPVVAGLLSAVGKPVPGGFPPSKEEQSPVLWTAYHWYDDTLGDKPSSAAVYDAYVAKARAWWTAMGKAALKYERDWSELDWPALRAMIVPGKKLVWLDQDFGPTGRVPSTLARWVDLPWDVIGKAGQTLPETATVPLQTSADVAPPVMRDRFLKLIPYSAACPECSGPLACPDDHVRDAAGACVCPQGQVENDHGQCVKPGGVITKPCVPPKIRGRDGTSCVCPQTMLTLPNGSCGPRPGETPSGETSPEEPKGYSGGLVWGAGFAGIAIGFLVATLRIKPPKRTA